MNSLLYGGDGRNGLGSCPSSIAIDVISQKEEPRAAASSITWERVQLLQEV